MTGSRATPSDIQRRPAAQTRRDFFFIELTAAKTGTRATQSSRQHRVHGMRAAQRASPRRSGGHESARGDQDHTIRPALSSQDCPRTVFPLRCSHPWASARPYSFGLHWQCSAAPSTSRAADRSALCLRVLMFSWGALTKSTPAKRRPELGLSGFSHVKAAEPVGPHSQRARSRSRPPARARVSCGVRRPRRAPRAAPRRAARMRVV